jgi:hypothetical protein
MTETMDPGGDRDQRVRLAAFAFLRDQQGINGEFLSERYELFKNAT